MAVDFRLLIAAVLLLIWLRNSVQRIREGERGVVLRLGQMQEKVLEPGWRLVLWPVEWLRRVCMEAETQEIVLQDVVTRDDALVRIKVRCTSRVTDAFRALAQVKNYREAVAKLAEDKLRHLTGEATLDDLAVDLDKLARRLRGALDWDVKAWGLEILGVELEQAER